ncbi:MAG: hypothetical protein QOE23_1880 [Pseudonocardiales bacterium]|jgi:hypothetical protein|nr:hypothetical protein [Pseudonocardiales bacterium]
MPEPLVSEDSDPQRLLDTVHSQPGAEVLYQDTVRRGGMFGFFAREVHRVAYRIAEPATAPEPEIEPGTATEPGTEPEIAAQLPALDDLLATADQAESAAGAGQYRTALEQPSEQPAAGHPEGHQDFAALLRSLTAGDPADAGQSGVLAAEPAPIATPAGDRQAGDRQAGDRPAAAEPVARSNVTAFGKPDARARLEMLMQLRQVGVPVSVNPRADTHSLYEALENILEELPAPAAPPRGAGEVLAVVGESSAALQAAHTCAAMLRIPRDSIGVAGLPEQAGAELDNPRISGQAEALRLRTELSRAELPSIVVIATDSTEAGPDDPWAAEMLAALRPTAVWAVVDARWKTEDSRAELDRLGRVDALVVHSAQLSASPASVWDLDLPLGLLDGRAASTFAWTGLLFRLLRGGARHRASA